jgi:putative FmdB family regulatory protein
MPTYEYRCAHCGPFEKRAGYEDRSAPCRCGGAATRAPFSGSTGVIVEGRLLPTNPVEKQQHDFKKLRESGWDRDRAITGIRKNIKTDKEGHKHFNAAGMNSA